MAFVVKQWLDRIVANPTRRTLTDTTTGTSTTVDVTRAEGDVTQEGTPLGATTFNDLESRIATAFDEKQDTLIAGENITIEGNVISATGGGSGDVTKAYVDQQDGLLDDKITEVKEDLNELATSFNNFKNANYDDLFDIPWENGIYSSSGTWSTNNKMLSHKNGIYMPKGSYIRINPNGLYIRLYKLNPSTNAVSAISPTIDRTTTSSNWTNGELVEYYAKEDFYLNMRLGLDDTRSQNITVDDMVADFYLYRPESSLRYKVMNPKELGDCAFVKFDNGEIMMIDCGGGDAIMRTNITDTITEWGITHINYLVMSHYHVDHCYRIDYLVDNGLVDNKTVVYLPSTPNTTILATMSAQALTNYERFMGYIATANPMIIQPQESTIIHIGGASVQFYNCNHDIYYNAWQADHSSCDYNDCCMICYITYGNTVILSLGDMAEYSQFLYRKKMRKCNILKTQHHGIRYKPEKLFMSSIMPEVGVTTLGALYAQNQNPTETASVFATDTNGVQQWFEDNHIPNYVTGTFETSVEFNITKNSWQIVNNCRRCIRADEGIISN